MNTSPGPRPPGQHYFSARPQTPSAPKQLTLALPDGLFHFTADTGVFSYDAIDAGTRVLLRHAPPPEQPGDVLDLGCGYGPITIVWAARLPETTVWATDINHRALDLTTMNAEANGRANVVAGTPEEIPADVRFAAIYSNPPIKVGKAALHEMLRTWLARLLPGGVAHLVVHRHLGADSLARWLDTQGYESTRTRSSGGYRLLAVRQRP